MADYISREAAIKELLDTYEREFPTADGAFDLFVVRIMPRVLRNIPAADVEPVRHGRLLRTGLDECYGEFGDCTVCGFSNLIGSIYCSECGTKLDGGVDDEM